MRVSVPMMVVGLLLAGCSTEDSPGPTSGDPRVVLGDSTRGDGPFGDVGDFDGDGWQPGDAFTGDSGCPGIWTVSGDGTATVSGGVLHLEAPFTKLPEPLRVAQSGLTGDFDLNVTYSNFQTGSAYSRLQMQIFPVGSPPPDPPALPDGADHFVSARRGEGTFSVVGQNGVDTPLDQSAATTSFAGSLHIIRSGSTVTVSSSGLGAIELATGQIAFTDEPLTVALELQTPVTASVLCGQCDAASVVLDDFVAFGTGVTADNFSCTSLIP